jgi:hypothetical protein
MNELWLYHQLGLEGIPYPKNSLMELDSTNMDWTDWPSMGVYENEDCAHMVREDPFDFYEDAKGG